MDDLREAGHIDLRVSDSTLAASVLERFGIHYGYVQESGLLRIPEYSDQQIGALISQLTAQGLQIYRVASERKSLEEAFLELVESPQATVRQAKVTRGGVQ